MKKSQVNNQMGFYKGLTLFFGLLLYLNTGCVSHKISKSTAEETSASPYALRVEQPDRTHIDVMGKGNMDDPYTETLDGYTVLRNKEGIYEYAIIGMENALEPSGIKANNQEDRSKNEIKFLKSIEKHLRNPNN